MGPRKFKEQNQPVKVNITYCCYTWVWLLRGLADKWRDDFMGRWNENEDILKKGIAIDANI